jgi:hypothetical protein
MKNMFYLIISVVFFFSCKEPYDLDLDTNSKIVVVDGLVTDSVGQNYITLGYAVPFHNSYAYSILSEANVYVTDCYNNVYYFEEISAGTYKPKDPFFKGVPGNSYILTFITKNGYLYKSTPQRILPSVLPVGFYYDFPKRDELIYDSYGSAIKVTRLLYSLKLNFKGTDNDTNTLRFRFVNKQCILTAFLSATMQLYYNWYTIDSNNPLNFTDEKYPAALPEINDYPVEEFHAYDENVRGLFYRILRINQFRINEDAYAYYKGIANQKTNVGNIFDPISVQLYGNIKCITDSSKLVLGFFETSSDICYSYLINGNYFTTIPIPNKWPPTSEGTSIDVKPDFWPN